MRLKTWLTWEYWPFWVFYIPVYVYWLLLCLRARGFAFFSAANPGMTLGGFVGASKYDAIKQFDEALLPNTLCYEASTPIETVLGNLQSRDMDYPLIVKPDIGMRGKGVEKVDNENELRAHINALGVTYMIQGYIDSPLEFGVFYHRFPGENTGHITSVTQKAFFEVEGDGERSLCDLIKAHPRSDMYLDDLMHRHKDNLHHVLEKGEVRRLVHIGNHCRGTMFLNKNDLISPAMVASFDTISRQIEGYHFGRYDLRCDTIEDLINGKVKIMELNGANSEATHVYEPGTSLFSAYLDVFKHWRILCDISIINHREHGVPYAPLSEAIRLIRKYA